MSLEDELKRFQKTDRFKQMVAQAKKEAIKNGKSFGTGGAGGQGFSKEQMRAYGFKMKEKLYWYAKQVIPSLEDYDILVGEPVERADGQYEVPVYFDPAAMERWSLDPYTYGKVDNIAVLLTHGWDKYEGRVVGVWHGKVTTGLRQRDANPFMQEVVDAFNAEVAAAGVSAELDDKYII